MLRKSDSGGIMRFLAGLGVLWVGVLVAGAIGWIMNVVALVKMLGDPTVTPMFLARIAGVVIVPLGAVLGWF